VEVGLINKPLMKLQQLMLILLLWPKLVLVQEKVVVEDAENDNQQKEENTVIARYVDKIEKPEEGVDKISRLYINFEQ
jgi:hypothetical protein